VISTLVIHLMRRSKQLRESKVMEKPKMSKKELQERKRKLDEDYVEDRISREEYLRRKSELEDLQNDM